MRLESLSQPSKRKMSLIGFKLSVDKGKTPSNKFLPRSESSPITKEGKKEIPLNLNEKNLSAPDPKVDNSLSSNTRRGSRTASSPSFIATNPELYLNYKKPDTTEKVVEVASNVPSPPIEIVPKIGERSPYYKEKISVARTKKLSSQEIHLSILAILELQYSKWG